MKLPEWSSGVGKDLLRLNDGDLVPGVFRGESIMFYQHWKNGQPTKCPGRETCEACKNGEKGSKRFRINFLVLVEGIWKAKVFEGGKRVFDQLKSINNDIPLEKAKVKIVRAGSGLTATTQIAVYPGTQGMVDDKLEKELLKAKLIDLNATEPEEEEEEAAGPTPFDSTENPADLE